MFEDPYSRASKGQTQGITYNEENLSGGGQVILLTGAMEGGGTGPPADPSQATCVDSTGPGPDCLGSSPGSSVAPQGTLDTLWNPVPPRI